MPAKELNFLKSQPEILRALIRSKLDGTTIAIRADVLGDDIIITAVEDIIMEGGEIAALFKHFDSSGYILPSRRINIEDIQEVCAFSTPFANPYLQNFGKDKTWFF